MQENINIPDSTVQVELTFRKLCLMNMQQLTNFPYIEKDFDALTDYELLCLVVDYLNNVIKNQNEQNDSITRMYNAFLTLQTYVNNTKDTLEDAFNTLDNYVRNYFNNLDVQDEVNNALDELVASGQMDEIFAQYTHKLNWFYITTSNTEVEINTMFQTPGAKVIEFEKGTYDFLQPIRVNANTKVILNNSIINSSNVHAFFNFLGDDTPLGYDGNGNIEILNGTIKGGSISFCHARNVIVKNITFEDILNDHCIEIAGCNNYLVEDCHFEGVAVQASNRNYVECIQIDDMTRGNFPHFTNVDNPTYDLTINDMITIRNCHFEADPTKEETNVIYTCVGGHTASGDGNRNILIENCYFTSWRHTAVRLYHLFNVTIRNCQFINNWLYDEEENPLNFITKDFITINNGIEDLKIRDNYFSGTGRIYWDATNTNCKNIEISNNYFVNNNMPYQIDQEDNKTMNTDQKMLYIINVSGLKGFLNICNNIVDDSQRPLLRCNTNSSFESDVNVLNNTMHLTLCYALVQVYSKSKINISYNNFIIDSLYNSEYGSLPQNVRKLFRFTGANIIQPLIMVKNNLPDVSGQSLIGLFDFQYNDYLNCSQLENIYFTLSTSQGSSSELVTLSGTRHFTDFKNLIMSVKSGTSYCAIRFTKTNGAEYIIPATFYGIGQINGTPIYATLTILSDTTYAFSLSSGTLNELRGYN